MNNGFSMLDSGCSQTVDGDSFAVIPVKTGIKAFVILSEAKYLARNRI